MKKITTILLSLAFSFSAFAEMNTINEMGYLLSLDNFSTELVTTNLLGEHKKGDGHHKHSCPDVKLTDDQKKQLKTLVKQLRLDMVDGQSKIKKAKIELESSYHDETATRSDIDLATNTLTAGIGEIINTKINFKHDVLFDIATKDQVHPISKCMKHMRHMKKMKRIKKICKKMDKHKKNKPDTGKEKPPGEDEAKN